VTVELTALGRKLAFDPNVVSPPVINEGLFPKPCSLALDISGSCNLRCVYCAENATMPHREPMQPQTLNQSIDCLFKWSGKGGVSIHLGSGEPLLNPHLVKEIDKRAHLQAKESHRELSLHLTTNGTLLNEEIERWLVRRGWSVKISIDGDQVIHDRFRVDSVGAGTFNRINPSVCRLAKKIPRQFSTTSVLCHGTDPKDVFYAIAAMFVRNIEMVPIATTQSSKYALRQEDLEAYRDYIFDYVQRLAKGEKVPVNIRFHKRLLKILGYGNSRVPCGAGRNFFGVGPDGQIYPCFRFVGLPKYALGDLSEISLEKAKEFTAWAGRPYEQRSQCQSCWAASLCGGPCYAVAELFGNGEALPSYCEIVKMEAEAALWLADYLRANNVERLVELMDYQVDEE
jgi:uncharacterized protein